MSFGGRDYVLVMTVCIACDTVSGRQQALVTVWAELKIPVNATCHVPHATMRSSIPHCRGVPPHSCGIFYLLTLWDIGDCCKDRSFLLSFPDKQNQYLRVWGYNLSCILPPESFRHPHCSQNYIQHNTAMRPQVCFELNQNISPAQTKPGNFALCTSQLVCSFLLCERAGHNPSSFGRSWRRSAVPNELARPIKHHIEYP